MKLRRARGQRGLSLIEVTIMLLVLMLLTSVLAPSIFDFVNDAQWVKVKEDCEVLAISVARLVKDVGPKLVWYPALNPTVPYPQYKLDLIVSDGRGASSVTTPAYGGPGPITQWYTGPDVRKNPNPIAGLSGCEEQFITNMPRPEWVGNTPNFGATEHYYREATGPAFGLGFASGYWRGAYLSPPCGPDPWGNAYQVNVKWLTQSFWNGGSTHIDHCFDVFCLSPGKDGIIDTPFATHNGVHRGGDDWVTVIAPCDP